MFDTLNIKELRLLLRELKAHHDIKGSSKMKKGQLVAALQERFILRDGNLYLKEDTRASAPRQTAVQLMEDFDGIEKKDYAKIKRELTKDLKGFAGDPLTKFYPILMKHGYEV